MRSMLGICITALVILTGCQSSRTREIDRGVLLAPDGVEIVYEAHGKGRPAVVFIHCWSCDRTFWSYQMNSLAGEYRVVALDLPGHGASGANRAEWTLAGLAADVEAVVNELELEEVILVGHSMGGPVALLTARRMPERVVGVVAVDTLHDAELEWPAQMAAQMAGRLEQDFEGTLAQMAPAMFPPDADEQVIDWVVERGAQTDQRAAVALLREFPDVDFRRAFAEANAPIRAINSAPWGRGGMVTDIATNRKYADYDAVILQDVGHYPMLEDPAQFDETLHAVLMELERRS